jgi:hypothetical protein
MAVSIRITSRGISARAAPAAFTLATTPMRATGGGSQRITAVYGTVPTRNPGPPIVMAIPPGPTNGHTAAIPNMYPTYSVVKPSLPRVLPTAGAIPHGIPGVTYTIASPNPPQDAVVKPAIRVRTGGNRGRVTTNPKPTFNWVRQGG